VQWVNRASHDFRGFSGTVASGSMRVGDEVVVAASRKPAKVARIVTMDGDLGEAVAGEAVTVVLDREVDVSRGDVLTHPGKAPEFSNQFQARVVWMHDEPAFHGRSYLVKIGTQTVPGTITSIKFRTNVNTLEHTAATKLELNEVGTVTIATDKPVAFDPYGSNARTGSFILIDRITNVTLGAGVIDFGLRRAQNLSYQSFDVDRKVRAELKGQEPAIVWFTGLSGSGKSTIANLVEKRLTAEGKHAYILDGDNVRHGLNKDLGFTEADRVENIRRVAEVARLMADAGLIVIVSFISPFRNERRLAREIAGDIRFTESTWIPRSRCARGATPRASTPAPAAARSRTSPASTAPSSRRSAPTGAAWRRQGPGRARRRALPAPVRLAPIVRTGTICQYVPSASSG
jgi:bifunctional enzyme CysN/CysC